MSSDASNLTVTAAIQNVAKREVFALSCTRIYSIGRAQQADLKLYSPQASKIHAVVFWDGRNWLLVDCSSNGTVVNGQEIRRVALADGDVMRFPGDGDLVFTSRVGQGQLPLPQSRGPGIVVEAPECAQRSRILGRHPATQRLRDEVSRLAEISANVLVVGEYGVGKRHLARALHTHGPRHHRSLVMVDCSTIEAAGIREELRPWLTVSETASADQLPGTVVLDGVDELSSDSQAALLDLLEESSERKRRGEYGDLPPRFVSLVMTQQDETEHPQVNSDLFSKLSVAQLFIEPLRSRRDDIPELAGYFYHSYASHGPDDTEFSPDVLSQLAAYDWPANVAELRNAVERAAMLKQKGPLDAAAFDRGISTALRDLSPYSGMSIEEVERRHIANTLKTLNWRKSRVARVLGIERSTLDRKIKRYEILRDLDSIPGDS